MVKVRLDYVFVAVSVILGLMGLKEPAVFAWAYLSSMIAWALVAFSEKG